MLDKYDVVRNRQRQGEEAKQNVLSGMYNRPTAVQDKYEVVRNRVVQQPAVQVASPTPVWDKIAGAAQGGSAVQAKPEQIPGTLFNRDLSPATGVSGTVMGQKQRLKEQQAAERQERALNSPLSKLTSWYRPAEWPTAKLIDRIVPKAVDEGLSSLLDGKTGGERLGEAIRETDIPGVTDTGPIPNFIRGIGDTATLGLSSYMDRQMGMPERAEGATQTTAGKTGQFVGYLLPGTAAWKVAGAATKGMANKAGQTVTRGTMGGAMLGTAREVGEYQLGVNEQSLSGRAADVALDTVLGGAGDLALYGLGKGVQMVRQAPGDVLASTLRNVDSHNNTAGEVQIGLTAPTGERSGWREIADGLPDVQAALPTSTSKGKSADPSPNSWEDFVQTGQQMKQEGHFTPDRGSEGIKSPRTPVTEGEGRSLSDLIERTFPGKKSRVRSGDAPQAGSSLSKFEAPRATITKAAERLSQAVGGSGKVLHPIRAVLERLKGLGGTRTQALHNRQLPSEMQHQLGTRASTTANNRSRTASNDGSGLTPAELNLLSNESKNAEQMGTGYRLMQELEAAGEHQRAAALGDRLTQDLAQDANSDTFRVNERLEENAGVIAGYKGSDPGEVAAANTVGDQYFQNTKHLSSPIVPHDETLSKGVRDSTVGVIKSSEISMPNMESIRSSSNEGTGKVGSGGSVAKESGDVVEETVAYSRVQGGQSKDILKVNGDGTLSLNEKFKSNDLNVSTGKDHAEYFKNKRGDGSYKVEFEAPKWLDELIQENAISQDFYKSNPLNQGGRAPKIVDKGIFEKYNFDGLAYELPSPVSEWLVEYAKNVRIVP
ncbi:hypothetical protein SAMN04487969_10656 [Paenibacillus algorifonticola]|uniref:Uncharacterized protein n=1 Tax=Paenibacillus algorifonticola TaxID=684063 RepID=A0A1I2D1Z7_9BACL|nr:hypothetical protein [Paenibacillus algorifonticola]SFE74577.1 hypothetical protein SAMN04487969_10656 [Paenibacillus algorifonticola]